MAAAGWRSAFVMLLINFVCLLGPLLVSGWNSFSCLNRKGRDFNITAMGWDDRYKTLYVVTDQEVLRVNSFEMIKLPSEIQRGAVSSFPVKKRKDLRPGFLIGIYRVAKYMYGIYFTDKKEVKQPEFKEISPETFDFNQARHQIYANRVNKFIKEREGANIVAQMGEKMLGLYFDEDSAYVQFISFEYTWADLGDMNYTLRKSRSSDLKLKAATWVRLPDEHYYYMIGYTGDNDMVVWATPNSLDKVSIQNRFWPGKLFGCYRTLCEGAKLENIFYDSRASKHIMVVDGGQLSIDSLDYVRGDLVPTDMMSGPNQTVVKPVGTAFTYKSIHYAFMHDELFTLDYQAGRATLSKSVSEDVKVPFMVFIRSLQGSQGTKFICAVQMGQRLALFTTNTFIFLDQIQNATGVTNIELRMKDNRLMFNLPDMLNVHNCYDDVKTKSYFFFTDAHYYRIPVSLLNVEKGKFDSTVDPLYMRDLWNCEKKDLPLLNEEAKYGLYVISGTLVFLLLVICCVFHQISRNRGRGGIGAELRRMRNRPNRRNLSKWQKSSAMSSAGSVASRSVIPSSGAASQSSSGSRSSVRSRG